MQLCVEGCTCMRLSVEGVHDCAWSVCVSGGGREGGARSCYAFSYAHHASSACMMH